MLSNRIIFLVVSLYHLPKSSTGTCGDNSKFCNFWANKYECYHNPRYMAITCALSCQNPVLCGGNTNDTEATCWARALNGKCETDTIVRLVLCQTTCSLRQEVLCDPPPEVPYASHNIKSDYRFMDRVLYNCDEGYEDTVAKVEGYGRKGSRICSENGEWNERLLREGAMPECKIITCGEPPTLNHTEMTYNGSLFRDVVTYRCGEGYEKLSGDDEKTCLADKTWNGSDLICTEIPLVESSSIDVATLNVLEKLLSPTPVLVQTPMEPSITDFYQQYISLTPEVATRKTSMFSLFITDLSFSEGSVDVFLLPTPSVESFMKSDSLLVPTGTIVYLDEVFLSPTESPLVEFHTSSSTEAVSTELLIDRLSEVNEQFSLVSQSITPSLDLVTTHQTSPSSITQYSSLCRCQCNGLMATATFSSMSFEAIMNMTPSVKKFVPKTVEAEGAKFVGASAIIILGCTFGLFILMDLVSLSRHINLLRFNLNYTDVNPLEKVTKTKK